MSKILILIRLLNFTISQVCFLYYNTISGQRLIDHSINVHKFACVLTSDVLPKLLPLILFMFDSYDSTGTIWQ